MLAPVLMSRWQDNLKEEVRFPKLKVPNFQATDNLERFRRDRVMEFYVCGIHSTYDLVAVAALLF